MRYNLFNKVHEPVRLALLNTCITLSKNEGLTITEATEAIKKVTDAIKVFKAQVKHEGLYILPMVFEYEPSIWDNYTREHHKAMNLASNVENLVQSFNKQKDEQEKLCLMCLVAEAFDEFMLFCYRHMDDEEEVLNEFFWRYYKDDVIVRFEKEIEVLPMSFTEAPKRKVLAAAHAA